MITKQERRRRIAKDLLRQQQHLPQQRDPLAWADAKFLSDELADAISALRHTQRIMGDVHKLSKKLTEEGGC